MVISFLVSIPEKLCMHYPWSGFSWSVMVVGTDAISSSQLKWWVLCTVCFISREWQTLSTVLVLTFSWDAFAMLPFLQPASAQISPGPKHPLLDGTGMADKKGNYWDYWKLNCFGIWDFKGKRSNEEKKLKCSLMFLLFHKWNPQKILFLVVTKKKIL